MVRNALTSFFASHMVSRSFHALDSDGTVYVWGKSISTPPLALLDLFLLGTLDGEAYARASDSFSQPGKEISTPHRLLLPDRVREIACGRQHALLLSERGVMYTLCAWGRPFVLRSPLGALGLHADHAIVQVVAGWAFCAARTHAGAVFVWWPRGGAVQQAYHTAARDMNERAWQGEGTREIPCRVLELAVEPVVLPEIPYDLPELVYTGESEDARRADPVTRIVKIAGADTVLIALTNRGHVLKYDRLRDEVEYTQGQWIYVSALCGSVLVVLYSTVLTSLARSYRCSATRRLYASSRHSRGPKATKSTSHRRCSCTSLTFVRV
jgi:SCF-associated factor 1